MILSSESSSVDQKTWKNLTKFFRNVWGCSGGWVSGCCIHGIVYVLKFVLRAESSRDYVDLLLSMKFQPNVTIIDMANMVAAHGNKRQRGMFHLHNGMVAEPCQENVDKARQRSLLVSLPWLDRSCRKGSTLSTEMEDAHPISGSDVKMCLLIAFMKAM